MKASVSTIFEVFTELSSKQSKNFLIGKDDPILNSELGEVAGSLLDCSVEIEIPENLQKILEKK